MRPAGPALLALALLLVGTVGAAPTPTPTPAPAPGSHAAATTVPAGMPPGVPAAATRPAPNLPAPAGWPFGEQFPRTSGTGRYAAGAYLFSDFLYDDHGAIGTPPPRNDSVGAPSLGTFRYPDAPRFAGNGADLFRVGIGLTDRDTYWRVDWNTLVDPAVPIATVALDTDDDPATGAAAWPDGAGVTSPGIETALTVSAAGAWLTDLTSGRARPVADLGGGVTVDRDAQSFVVRLPRTALEPGTATWRVRVAAGVATADGRRFAPVDPSLGGRPGSGVAVYNVGFRGYDDETPANNFWFDTAQATALASGDVTAFSAAVDVARLARHDTEPPPKPTGVSNRWYVSSVAPGAGRVTGEASTADDAPNELGRVQPYSVYVPTGYDPMHPAPLTWLLHSFTINHNQYAATTPRFLAQACEARGSLCATTLGRGPDGWYQGLAELDFWEVWHDLADHYALDPDRTIIGGYSMGGFGTYHLGLDHPDLFAAAVVLAAAPRDAGTDPDRRDELPRLENARWLPIYHAHGGLDELVPVTEALRGVDQLDRLGYRYRFDLFPAADHVVTSLQDGFDEAAAFMAEGDRRRVSDPARFTYRWFPTDVDDDLGLGPHGAWWVRGLAARDPVRDGRVVARSHALPYRPPTTVRAAAPVATLHPSPGVRRELTWRLGAPLERRPAVDLQLENVAQRHRRSGRRRAHRRRTGPADRGHRRGHPAGAARPRARHDRVVRRTARGAGRCPPDDDHARRGNAPDRSRPTRCAMRAAVGHTAVLFLRLPDTGAATWKV